jgi:hypothetical protein
LRERVEVGRHGMLDAGGHQRRNQGQGTRDPRFTALPSLVPLPVGSKAVSPKRSSLLVGIERAWW